MRRHDRKGGNRSHVSVVTPPPVSDNPALVGGGGHGRRRCEPSYTVEEVQGGDNEAGDVRPKKRRKVEAPEEQR